jgi:hypothetical protein
MIVSNFSLLAVIFVLFWIKEGNLNVVKIKKE